MGRRPVDLNFNVRLLKNTTYGCGYVERLVINLLRRNFPYRVKASEIIDTAIKYAEKYGPAKGRIIKKVRYEVLEAIRRLEQRKIIETF